MDAQPNMIAAIIIVHLIIALVQFSARRLLPLRHMSSYGIYVMLMPVGFNCFGVGLSPYIVAASVLLGLTLLVWGLSRAGVVARAS